MGIKAETPEDVGPAIEKANSIDDRPVVVDFRTDAREKVYPMVAAGSSNDDIVVHPDQLAGQFTALEAVQGGGGLPDECSVIVLHIHHGTSTTA